MCRNTDLNLNKTKYHVLSLVTLWIINRYYKFKVRYPEHGCHVNFPALFKPYIGLSLSSMLAISLSGRRRCRRKMTHSAEGEVKKVWCTQWNWTLRDTAQRFHQNPDFDRVNSCNSSIRRHHSSSCHPHLLVTICLFEDMTTNTTASSTRFPRGQTL